MSKNPPQDSLMVPRTKLRKRVLWGGIIASTDGSKTLNCAIRDISDSGARLSVRDQNVPAKFYLIHLRDRLGYDAKTVWKKGTEVGVEFESCFRLADIADASKQFLTKLWLAQAVQ